MLLSEKGSDGLAFSEPCGKIHVEPFLVCADLKIYRTVLGLDALGFRSGFTTLPLHSVDKFCRAGVHNSQLQLIDDAVGFGGIDPVKVAISM